MGLKDSDLIPVEETKVSSDKHIWKWMVRVDRLDKYSKLDNGTPQVERYTVMPDMVKVTTGTKEQEIELIHYLCSDRGNYNQETDSPLYKVLKRQKDGLYRLCFFKQTFSGRISGREIYGFYGYVFISKHLDKVLWESRYIQFGKPFYWNNDTRDPLEDVRNKNYDDIPGGGIDRRW